ATESARPRVGQSLGEPFRRDRGERRWQQRSPRSRRNGRTAHGVSVMQLGFVSAILADLTLEEVLAYAADEGFGCVELMCWPPGSADRRYAGVTHIDVP